MSLFRFIEESLSYYSKKSATLEETANYLDSFFLKLFQEEDSFLTIKSRVKSANSFREKIIRNNMYLKYRTPENVFDEMQDLIGLRIECRFNEDEKIMYKKIQKKFSYYFGNGQYSVSRDCPIYLQLKDPQPQFQRNGFEIYKIDGYYLKNGEKLNFELQIKSMVNSFWSEIDHKVLYKNYNYMMSEDFFRDIMYSIRDNLNMVDSQLKILYDQINKMDRSKVDMNLTHLKALLSKLIHDIYAETIRAEFGFVMNINLFVDIVVEYLLFETEKDIDNIGQMYIYLINRLNDLFTNHGVVLSEPFDISEKPLYFTKFSSVVGRKIYPIVNKDFRWFLFFKMITQILNSPLEDEFLEFFLFLETQIQKNILMSLKGIELTQEQREEISNFLMDILAQKYAQSTDIVPIFQDIFFEQENYLPYIANEFNSYETFMMNKNSIRQYIEKSILM